MQCEFEQSRWVTFVMWVACTWTSRTTSPIKRHDQLYGASTFHRIHWVECVGVFFQLAWFTCLCMTSLWLFTLPFFIFRVFMEALRKCQSETWPPSTANPSASRALLVLAFYSISTFEKINPFQPWSSRAYDSLVFYTEQEFAIQSRLTGFGMINESLNGGSGYPPRGPFISSMNLHLKSNFLVEKTGFTVPPPLCPLSQFMFGEKTRLWTIHGDLAGNVEWDMNILFPSLLPIVIN